MYAVIITGSIELFFTYETFVQFLNDSLIMFSLIVASSKSLNIVTSRKSISRIIEILETDPCSPRDDDEADIQDEFNGIMR